jgi:hypothetical protein
MLQTALVATQESEGVDFKEGFEPSAAGEWCELLKDIFAMVNSGGGVILFGVRNDGSPSERSLTAVATLDPAKLTDKVAAYTGVQYSAFSITSGRRFGHSIIALCLGPIPLTLIPHRPGSYASGSTQQATAFARGVVYFRHGAKSEPGDAFDIERFLDRRLRQLRRSWLSGVRKVVTAPPDSVVSVVVGPAAAPGAGQGQGPGPSGVRDREIRVSLDGSASPVRLTTDPSAPAYRLVTPDETHPHRTMEFLRLLNQRLAVQCVRATAYDLRMLCGDVGPEVAAGFCHQPKHGPRQYSDGFADWIADKVAHDRTYLSGVHARHRREQRRVWNG